MSERAPSGLAPAVAADPYEPLWQPDPRLREAWESSPALISLCIGPGHVMAYQNRAAREKFGTALLGRPLSEGFPSGHSQVEHLDEVLRTGRSIEVAPHQVGPRDVRGDAVYLHYVLSPWGEPGAPPDGVVIMAVDVTAATRAEQAATRNHLLADLTATLIDARDAETGLAALADQLVASIADVAAVFVSTERDSDPDSPPVPPQVMSVAPRLLESAGPPPDPSERSEFTPWREAVLAGDPIVAPIDDRTLPLLTSDRASADWMRTVEATSLAVVPLVVAGTMNGALVLLTAGERPPYTDEDLPFLSDAAARLGAAIAQLHQQQRQRDVALRLQRALLPSDPPRFDFLSFAARYLPGSPEIEIGGDWWDIRDLGDGTVAIGIGDVAGRGISAAVVMGQARAGMHAASHTLLPPAAVLRMLDQHLHEVASPGRLDAESAPRFATASYGVLDARAGRLRMANAGHLPFLHRDAAGKVRTVTLPPAPPLGLLIGGFTEGELDVRPGDTLALFTDGLVESRTQDLDSGVAQLARAFADVGADDDLERIADALLHAMGRHEGEGADDLTLLVLRVTG